MFSVARHAGIFMVEASYHLYEILGTKILIPMLLS